MFICGTAAQSICAKGDSIKVLIRSGRARSAPVVGTDCASLPLQGRSTPSLRRRVAASTVRRAVVLADAATADRAASTSGAKDQKTKITVFSAAPYVQEFLEGDLDHRRNLPSRSRLPAGRLSSAFRKLNTLRSGCMHNTYSYSGSILEKCPLVRFPTGGPTAPLGNAFEKVEYVDARLGSSTAQLAKGSDIVCLFVNDHW